MAFPIKCPLIMQFGKKRKYYWNTQSCPQNLYWSVDPDPFERVEPKAEIVRFCCSRKAASKGWRQQIRCHRPCIPHLFWKRRRRKSSKRLSFPTLKFSCTTIYCSLSHIPLLVVYGISYHFITIKQNNFITLVMWYVMLHYSRLTTWRFMK